jgi:hypothetical protein
LWWWWGATRHVRQTCEAVLSCREQGLPGCCALPVHAHTPACITAHSVLHAMRCILQAHYPIEQLTHNCLCVCVCPCRGPRSALAILRPGLALSELAVSPLPGAPTAVFTLKASPDDEQDGFIVVCGAGGGGGGTCVQLFVHQTVHTYLRASKCLPHVFVHQTAGASEKGWGNLSHLFGCGACLCGWWVGEACGMCPPYNKGNGVQVSQWIAPKKLIVLP